jgi:hypothetical protein
MNLKRYKPFKTCFKLITYLKRHKPHGHSSSILMQCSSIGSELKSTRQGPRQRRAYPSCYQLLVAENDFAAKAQPS